MIIMKVTKHILQLVLLAAFLGYAALATLSFITLQAWDWEIASNPFPTNSVVVNTMYPGGEDQKVYKLDGVTKTYVGLVMQTQRWLPIAMCALLFITLFGTVFIKA